MTKTFEVAERGTRRAKGSRTSTSIQTSSFAAASSRSSVRACVGFVVAGLALSACAPMNPVGSTEQAVKVCASGPVLKGLDVSHYDGTVDWPSVKATGISFAFMKASEATDDVDPQFATNWANAKSAGIVRGAYHFLRASVDATAQADYFLSTIGPILPGDIPPTVDLEVTDGESSSTVAQSALTFLARIKSKTGVTPIVYTSASFISSIGDPSGLDDYTLWVAHWTTGCASLPTEWSNWTFWQNSNTGSINGVSSSDSELDTDEFNGTIEDLNTLTGATATTTTVDAGDPVITTGTPSTTDGGSTGTPGVGADLGSSPKTDAGKTGRSDIRGGCAVGGGGTDGAFIGLALAALCVAGTRRRVAH